MEKVTFARKHGVLIATLCNMEKRNALGADMLRALNNEICTALRTKEPLKAIVYTHEGNTFCSGADLDEFKKFEERKDLVKLMMEEFSALLTLNHTSRIPTVSFLKGGAIGGGVGLALSCQYVVASPAAFLKLPELSLGIFPYIISSALLRKLGTASFIDLVMPGTVFDAAELKGRNIADAFLDNEAGLLEYAAALKRKNTTIAPLPLTEQELSGLAEGTKKRGVDPYFLPMIESVLRINKEMTMPMANMAGSAELSELLKFMSRHR